MPVGYGHSGGDKRHHCGLDLCRSSEIASSGSTSSFPDFRTVSVPYITFYNDLGKLLNVESCRQAAVIAPLLGVRWCAYRYYIDMYSSRILL